MKKLYAVLSVLLALAFVLSACGTARDRGAAAARDRSPGGHGSAAPASAACAGLRRLPGVGHRRHG